MFCGTVVLFDVMAAGVDVSFGAAGMAVGIVVGKLFVMAAGITVAIGAGPEVLIGEGFCGRTV